MTTSYVAFDTRSGDIVSVHYGAEDDASALERAQRHARIEPESVAILSVPADTIERGRPYKVDLDSGELIEAPEDAGVSFAIGSVERY